MSARKVSLPVIAPTAPAMKWRWARRFTQAFALAAIVVGPLLGGWQRLDRNYLSAWDATSWDLPEGVASRLPLGEAPRRAYEANELLGGGMAVEYVGIPAIDPVAGAIAFVAAGWSLTFAVAWIFPLLLGLAAGRAFCGWLCPFGTVARAIDATLRRLPWRPRAWRVPEHRPLRWIALVVAVVASVAGIEALLYVVLPHALLQQSVYALWLMGGVGAGAGWLLGLLAAGIVFGPTTYCASLCPTGGALSLLGRARVARLTLQDESTCGRHCTLCARACWIGLDPSSGDPGPDCDLCGRCVEVCPRTNLRVGFSQWPVGRRIPSAASIGLSLLALASDASASDPVRDTRRPRMLVEARRANGDVTAFASVVDLAKVRLEADDPQRLSGARVSIVITRGSGGEPDELGKLTLGAVYAGPLAFRLESAAGDTYFRTSFDSPNQPYSTPRRAIYRRDVDVTPSRGDALVVEPIQGWMPEGARWEIPRPNPAGGFRFAGTAAAGFLFFCGLCSIALAMPRRESS